MLLDALNIPNVIQASLGGMPFSNPTRVPMLLTSTKRLKEYQTLAGLPTNDLIAAQKRINAVLTESTAIGKAQAIINMAVNPNSIGWKQPKRIVKRDVQEGSIFFHFSNSLGQNNDILTMEFRGNTGYINLDADVNTGAQAVGAYEKMLIWHSLWNLTREPMLLKDKTINQFYIMYTSPIIPMQVMLIGFFSSVLDWTDSADKPFSKDYTMSFTVQETIPSIDDFVATISSLPISVTTV